MTKFDEIYRDIVMDIVNNGEWQEGAVRAKYADGTPARTKFKHGIHFEIKPEDGIPVLQSKKVAVKTALVELEWIWQELSNDVNWLQERKCKVWNEWQRKDGSIGKSYGYQLAKECRKHKRLPLVFNQVEYVIHELKNNPQSRRIMTSLWDVDDLDDMALEPCVWATNWRVVNGRLNLFVKQRSADMALGQPFNTYQYSILHRLMADQLNYDLGTMYWTIDDAHIYDRHIDTIVEQVNAPLPSAQPMIQLPDKFREKDDEYLPRTFFERRLSETKIMGYEYNGVFKYEIAE